MDGTRDDQMTIIEERMRPGTGETLHVHAKSRQFFFVLSSIAVMEPGSAITVLKARTGLEILCWLSVKWRSGVLR
jgi:mannose-6-phosphate isomerase-like protein (cupin superfamily)